MDADSSEYLVACFVLELMHTGSMMGQLVSSLTADLPADAYPGEEPRAVVVEMLCGTVATALAAVEPSELKAATELIDQAGARTIEHLELARGLARRMHGEDGGVGRGYG